MQPQPSTACPLVTAGLVQLEAKSCAQGYLDSIEGGVCVLQIFAAGPSCFSHFQLILHIFIQAHEFSVMSLVNAQMTQGLTKVFQISCCTLQYQHISNPFKGF